MLLGVRGRATAPGPDFLDLHLASCAASDGHERSWERGGIIHCWILALASAPRQVWEVAASVDYAVVCSHGTASNGAKGLQRSL
jgi:hypothetical protein